MKAKFEKIMQEVESRSSSINLYGEIAISECMNMIEFINDRLSGIKNYLVDHPFSSEEEEIVFFKYQKPLLLGWLMYYHKIYRIESKCPPYEEQKESYYLRRQEELKLFFDRHASFYQYCRSGATHNDSYYFVRAKQGVNVETEVYDFDKDLEFSTGYDRLAARIISMDMLYNYLSEKRNLLLCLDGKKPPGETVTHRWTGKIVEIVELVYALDTCKCVDGGKIKIEDLAEYLGSIFDIDIKHCFNTYMDIRKRKGDSRTYFLDELGRQLNERMNSDDAKIRSRG